MPESITARSGLPLSGGLNVMDQGTRPPLNLITGHRAFRMGVGLRTHAAGDAANGWQQRGLVRLLVMVVLLTGVPLSLAEGGEDAGLQPGETFTGPGPCGTLVLDCPPRILVCVYTEPVEEGRAARGRPGAAVIQPEPPEALLQRAAGCSKEIRFRASSAPQEVDALDRLYVIVASNVRQWRVVAEATGLAGEAGVIPASRLSTCHWNSGGAYVSLGAPIEVATGGRQAPRVVNVMYFRAHIEPADGSGTYTGKINFTALISP